MTAVFIVSVLMVVTAILFVAFVDGAVVAIDNDCCSHCSSCCCCCCGGGGGGVVVAKPLLQ